MTVYLCTYTNNNEIWVDYMPKKVDKMAQMTSPNYSADVIRRPNTANYWSPVYVFIIINNIFI